MSCKPAGLSSTDAVQLTAALEQALGRELPPTLAFDYPTVASLVAFLTPESAAAAPQPAADPDAELLSSADPRPQRVPAVSQPGLRLRATASLHTAIVATHLQLPEAVITSGDSAFGLDRCTTPCARRCILAQLLGVAYSGAGNLGPCCGLLGSLAEALSTHIAASMITPSRRHLMLFLCYAVCTAQ